MGAIAAPRDAVAHALESLQGNAASAPIACSKTRTLVMFNEHADGISEICQRLSVVLSAPVFYLHVHDDDLWMYEFFVGGEAVDRFNTKPDNWSTVDEVEERRWKGNPDTIAQHWPGAKADLISRYLVNHSKDKVAPQSKAYKSDKAPYWDCWQIADFMEKLGVPFPSASANGASTRVSSFAFDMDSLILAGLGLYGFYASATLNGVMRISGVVVAVLLLLAGALGFFMKRPARIAGMLLMALLALFGLYRIVTMGVHIDLIIIILCGIGAGAYFVNEYRTLK